MAAADSPERLPDYRELGSYTLLYTFDCPVGVWRARLDDKAWGKRRNILLYFSELETGKKYCLSVFNETRHAADDGIINFRYRGRIGECFELETGKSRTGRSRFLAARIVPGPDAAQPHAEAAVTPVS
ncbi:MAG TPA: hypothetical protein VMH80_03735 [Bryobacteraceae bacterium]|nr:hypothetical protein [Bryobacteraceae bacterium]